MLVCVWGGGVGGGTKMFVSEKNIAGSAWLPLQGRSL